MTRKAEAIDLNGQRQLPPRLLLEEFSLLFYIGKILGINSHDWGVFRKYKQLKKSPTGDCYVIVMVVMIFINFNMMVLVFQNSEYRSEKDNLAVAIGYVLTYFSLLTYLTDRITAVVKQDRFAEIFETLQELQEDFMDLGIKVNNSFIKYRIMLILLIATISESLIFIFTFAFLVDRDSWSAWLWSFTSVPTFFNSLDKIWYNTILGVIRNYFKAINGEFDEVAVKLQSEKTNQKVKVSVLSVVREKKWKKFVHNSKIEPSANSRGELNNYLGEVVCNPQLFSVSMATIELMSPPPESSSLSFEMLQERFVKLCQLHDGLCVAGKNLNELWALPNMALMGYGFFIITAQLYFFYCSSSNQVIPSLFRPARNLGITAIYLFYISGKCISILMFSWLTNLESKKTGICIHRCALAADKDEVYEMVNHLSLKLFNHVVSFNACGYFSLNMETLFSFCGGITTYLIILIQFNIEEQQLKIAADAKALRASANETTLFTFYQEILT